MRLAAERLKRFILRIGTDEDEHSIEMHLPFVARIMGNKPYKLVPILVGSLSVDSERAFRPFCTLPSRR